MPREIHIWEFPLDFWIQLKPNVVKSLANRAAEKVGGLSHLARILRVPNATLYNYRVRRKFFPLQLLLQTCEVAGNEFSIERMEPHIIAYKGGKRTHPIRNPKLPLVEAPELFALMGHLVGDGGHDDWHAYFSNTNETLVCDVKRLLQNQFGDIPARVSIRRRKMATKDLFHLSFSITLIRLLTHLFGIDFRTYTARVPQRLFELPKEYAAAFLRAFSDDEGYVDDLRISVCSANRTLIQDIYDLVQAKFSELGEFMVVEEEISEYTKYVVRFRRKAFKKYKALIGFSHPEKQQELNRILVRSERGWVCRGEGSTRQMLLEALRSSPTTAKELARVLEVTTNTIRYHLKDLITLNFTRISGKGTEGTKLFEITERGRNVLELPSIGLLHLGRAGQRRVEILKTLGGEDMTIKQLVQKLAVHPRTIELILNGRQDCKTQGMVTLGLIKRVSRGGRFTPDIYCLTKLGKRFFAELDTLFPELCGSA